MAPKEMIQKVGENGFDMDDFTKLIKDEGDRKLHIVDVYTHWCGPCASMVPTFKNMQVNIDRFEDRCTITQVDRIDMESINPEEWKDRFPETSKPRFLFFKGGEEKLYVEGVQAPTITKFIDENMPPLDSED
mmetsp:Transcript_65394/g.191834  ORF Transcript_65394/g.191834 Transcript_65394/m.191834 type:complete len:132 (-) Transcript_65394:111-506(-)